MRIEAYTDGACKPNPGKGGWGWVAYYHKDDIESTLAKAKISDESTLSFSDWGGCDETTNNRMELTGMVEVFKFLGDISITTTIPYEINIYSDSKYVLGHIIDDVGIDLKEYDPCEGWISKWVNKNKAILGAKNTEGYWKDSTKKNLDIAYELHQHLLKFHKNKVNIKFAWVKGHEKSKGNIEADRLSNMYFSKNKK